MDDEVRRAASQATGALGTRSRLFPAYGFATLQRGGREGVAVTLSVPQYRGHRHHDFLDLGLYAMGKALLPDFGYPETASADDPRRFGFFANSVAHNTVMIDAQDQIEASPYLLHAYDVTPVLQRVDASAPGVYPGRAQSYRRCVALIPIDQTHAYVVDFFQVSGGRQHDWLVHGSQAELRCGDLALPPPAPGTVAGPDVPYGFFYDDPRLQNPPPGTSYSGYHGSGFQFLTGPQTIACAPAVYRVEWRWTRDATPGHLSLWCVGDGEQAIVCSGKPQNRKELPETVKFLIRRRTAAGDRPLESVFASVFEPFADAPLIRKVERVELSPAATGAVALRVSLPDRTDLVVFGAGDEGVATTDGTRVRGDFAYLSLDAGGRARRAYVANGGTLAAGELTLDGSGSSGAPSVPLKVATADWNQHTVTLDGPIPANVAVGQVVMFGEGRYAYEIRAIDRKARRIDLGDQECVVARGDVDRIQKGGPTSGGAPDVDPVVPGASPLIETSTTIPFARPGMHLLDEHRALAWRIQKIEGGRLALSGKEDWPGASRRFWIVDYGPGDRVLFSAPGLFEATGGPVQEPPVTRGGCHTTGPARTRSRRRAPRRP